METCVKTLACFRPCYKNNLYFRKYVPNDLLLQAFGLYTDDYLLHVTYECRICSEYVFESDMITCSANENHKICSECVKNHLETLISERRGDRKCCFESTCDGLIHKSTVKKLISYDAYNQLLQQQTYAALCKLSETIPNFKICPFCQGYGCKFNPKTDVIENEQYIKCKKCSKWWCIHCALGPHNGPCIMCNAWYMIYSKDKKVIEQRVEELVEGAWYRKCIGCNIAYDRVDGCSEIRCTNCNNSTCWVCEAGYYTHEHYGRNVTENNIFRTAHAIMDDTEDHYQKTKIRTLIDDSPMTWRIFHTYRLKIIRAVYLLHHNTDRFIQDIIISKTESLGIFSLYIDKYKNTTQDTTYTTQYAIYTAAQAALQATAQTAVQIAMQVEALYEAQVRARERATLARERAALAAEQVAATRGMARIMAARNAENSAIEAAARAAAEVIRYKRQLKLQHKMQLASLKKQQKLQYKQHK